MAIDQMLMAAQGQVHAAWVQAIGSVLAILAAGAFPIYHMNVAGRHRQRDLVDTLRVLALQVMEMQKEVKDSISSDSGRRGAANFESPELHGPLLTVLERFPVQDFKDRRHLVSWLELMDLARRANHIWKFVVENGLDEDVDWAEWDLRVDYLGSDIFHRLEEMVYAGR